MAGKGYDDSGSSDTFLIVVFVAIIALYMVMVKNFHVIAGIWKCLRIMELYLFYWIPDWFPFYGKLEIKEAIAWLWSQPANELMPDTVYEFDQTYAKWFTWIPGAIMVYFGAKHIVKGDNVGMRYDMEQLLKHVKQFYPSVVDYVDNRPDKMDANYKREKPETSKWGISLSPADFALMAPPLGLEEEAKEKKWAEQSIWDGKEAFDMDLAERAFRVQLGKTFGGVPGFSPAEKKLYDFLMPKLNVNVKEMSELTRDILRSILNVKDAKKINNKSITLAEKTLYSKLKEHTDLKLKDKKIKKEDIFDYRAVEKLVLSKDFSKIYKQVAAERIMGQHAFTRVGFMSLLVESRNGGVVACNEFNWLKGEDRVLWYCMSSVGRKVSFVESAGCFAHWLIEQQLGRPLPHPEVHEAIEGLITALKLNTKAE
jgi:hypothetical protein